MSERELEDYVQEQLESGYSPASIERALERNGWSKEEIQDAFRTARRRTSIGEVILQSNQTYTEQAFVVVEEDGRSTLDRKIVKKEREVAPKETQKPKIVKKKKPNQAKPKERVEIRTQKKELELEFRAGRVRKTMKFVLVIILLYGGVRCFEKLGWINSLGLDLYGDNYVPSTTNR